jgi:RNA polymerase sigma-70 factor (ECF subfamily)
MASGDVTMPSSSRVLGEATAETGLVELCRAGDSAAFARLVSLHEGMVYGLAARLLGDAEEARDLAQEVFLQVYRTLGRFQGRSSLRTWIFRIVVNLCRNRQRLWRRRFRHRWLAWEDLSLEEAARLGRREGLAAGPFEALERRERGARVQAALSRVSFDHRVVLLLREVEGLSCEEVSSTLGLPVGTVKSRLARAREALRAALSGAGPEVRP